MTVRGRSPWIAMPAGLVLAIACTGSAFAAAHPSPPELAAAKAAVAAERNAEAESLATVALAALERAPVPDSLAIADALEASATAHWRRSGYADGVGLRLSSRVLAIRERHLPTNDLRVADAHALVARFLPEIGRPDSAKAEVRKALAIREAQPAPDDTLIAKTWDQLALVQRNSGDMRGALDSWTHAIELQKRAHGPEDPEVARLLAQTGVPYMELGDVDRAREVLEASLLMFARTAPDDVRRWIPLNILADVEKRSGNLTRNVDLLQEALRVVIAGYGDDSREALTVRANLAIGLDEFGDDAGAAALNREILPAARAQYGPGHYRTTSIELGLALASMEIEDWDAAEAMLHESEQAMAAVPGPRPIQLARTRAKYSELLFLLGRDAEARVMADSAVAAALGMRNPDAPTLAAAYAVRLHALSESGDTASIAAARRDLARVVERDHLEAHRSGPYFLLYLAQSSAWLGDADEAWRLMLEAERRAREIVQLNLYSLPDRRMLLFTQDESRYIDQVLELARTSRDESRRKTAFDRLVRTRGAVSAEMARRRLPEGSATDTALVDLHDRWIAAQREWSRRIVRFGGSPRDSAQRAVLERLRAAGEDAEAAYAKALAAHGSSAPPSAVGGDDVRARLRPGQALVTFAYENRELLWRIGRDHMGIVALVARGGSDGVEMIDLGRSTPIKDTIRPWLAQLAVSPGAGARKGDAAERETRKLGAAVRAATWDKLSSALSGATDVYVVGDGILQQLPWSALPEGKDRYLVEAGPRIHELDSERELAEPSDAPASSSLLALGAPDFDRGAAGDAPAAIQVAALVRSSPDPCADPAAARFAPLPASGDEAESAARAWRALPGHEASVLTGAAASEGAFKRSAPGHAVLHLATHGVVMGDRCAAANGTPDTRGVGGLEPVAAAKPKTAAASGAADSPSKHVSPWISRRVWLALAGANRAREHEGDDNEGLLTAEEVVTLDLTGTDWVVLSACHSGVSDWSREGALGMRRAFSLAGARTVISSQWAVEDASTAEWMKALYAARASGAASGAAAVESASRAILTERRTDGRTTHPFYWAAFGAIGE